MGWMKVHPIYLAIEKKSQVAYNQRKQGGQYADIKKCK